MYKDERVRILQKLYEGFLCKVCIGGSALYMAYIHQWISCAMMMMMYLVFINDMLEELQIGISNVNIRNEVINCTVFADDIFVLSTSNTFFSNSLFIEGVFHYCSRRFTFATKSIGSHIAYQYP